MYSNKATEQVQQANEPEFQQTTLKIPFEVWRAVHIEALNRRVSARDIWVEAVQKLLKLKAA